MVARKLFLLGVLLVITLSVQTTVVNLLPLPFGQPWLVPLLVIAVALAQGSYDGMVFGFLAGLLADLISDHPVGLLALVCCVTGYLAGKAAGSGSVPVALVVVAIGSGLSALAFAGMLGLLGTGRLNVAVIERTVPAVAVYNMILAPFAVPAVAKLTTWFQPREAW